MKENVPLGPVRGGEPVAALDETRVPASDQVVEDGGLARDLPMQLSQFLYEEPTVFFDVFQAPVDPFLENGVA